MRIWVDGDACPRPIKQILFRAAERARILVTVVANRALYTPRSEWIRSVKVPRGFDVADRSIVERIGPGDLVVTADIPLAAEVVGRGALALSPRGVLYDEENVGEALAMRDLLDGLRDEGVATGGPAAFSHPDRQAFANQLDRWLARRDRDG